MEESLVRTEEKIGPKAGHINMGRDEKQLYEDIGALKEHAANTTKSIDAMHLFLKDHMTSEERIIGQIKKQLFFIFCILLVVLASSLPLKSLISIIMGALPLI